ncbi:MAG: tyrosine-protein phosphatase [Actinomycetota bacterium]|nr:tyrosine-protein phosphatase [Actinomycetota bacterium]
MSSDGGHRRVEPPCRDHLALPGTGPEGSFNFRDIGAPRPGCRSGIRRGLVYRCGSLDGLSQSGWEQLAGLQVRTMFDLRTAAERDAEPTSVPASLSLRTVWLPMWASSGSSTITATPEVFSRTASEIAEAVAIDVAGKGSGDVAGKGAAVPARGAQAETAVGPAQEGRLPPEAARALQAYVSAKESAYSSIAALHQGTFARLVAEMAVPGTLPCVIHCSAGKDRTGIAAAVLLRLAGTSCKYVVGDYLASRLRPSARRVDRYLPGLQQLGVPLEQFLQPYGGHVPALRSAFDVMERRGGAVAGYLARGGLRPEQLEQALNAIARSA